MDTYTKPDYSSVALLTIDTQNDFSLPGSIMEIKGTFEVIPNIVRILKIFREKKRFIIHIVRLYKKDGSNADIARKKRVEEGLRAAVPGSEGAELVKKLKPNNNNLDARLLLSGGVQEIGTNEYVVYKSRWGAFYSTPLEKFLQDRKINTLVFTGCNFPNCPRTSIYEASERDFKIIVVKDAISGLYDKGLEEMKNIGCAVLNSNELINRISELRKY